MRHKRPPGVRSPISFPVLSQDHTVLTGTFSVVATSPGVSKRSIAVDFFMRLNVGKNGLTESVDAVPTSSISHAIFVRSNVDDVAMVLAADQRRDRVVRLLVGDDDHAIRIDEASFPGICGRKRSS